MYSQGYNKIIKPLKDFFQRLLGLYVKANYHEIPVIDKEGNIIGAEFVTTHEGTVIRPNIITNDNDESNPPNNPSTIR
jgi:hypothetical protein